MGRITKWHSNKVVGKPPKGCKQCSLGGKLVLFITGTCDSNCFYCPLTKERREDVIFANEQLVKTVQEAVEEAKMISALGMGITGGEPTLTLDRTTSFLTTFKEEFGENFHTHLYTSHSLSVNQLRQLKNAGLDELRFHPPRLNLSDEMKESIINAKSLDWNVGMEIPVIPDQEEKIDQIINFAVQKNLDFINLNEFEITEANIENLAKKGYRTKSDISAAVEGSESLAYGLLKKHKKAPITIHYCSSKYKDNIQLRNRLLRRAKNYAKSFDEITDEGLIVRGRIIVETITSIKEISNSLRENYDVDIELIEIDESNLTIYTHWQIAQEIGPILCKENENKIDSIQIIHQYPYSDGIITFLEPIYEKSMI